MNLALKKTIGFVIILFCISVLIELVTDRNFTQDFFVKKAVSNLLAGVIYFLIMNYTLKKST